MRRVDEVKLDYRLVRRAFGPFKLPDDRGAVERIEQEIVVLVNAMPEQRPWIEALLPLELQQRTWREAVVQLGWPESDTGMYRVSETRLKVWQAISKQVEPLTELLISLEHMEIPRRTYDYGSLAKLLGVPRYVVKTRHKAIDHDGGDGLAALIREHYMSRSPTLFDYLFLEGEAQFKEHLSHFERHIEDKGKVSEPLRDFVLRYLQSGASELAIAEAIGSSRQWSNQLKAAALQLFGISMIERPAYMRRVFRFPAAEAWRGLYVGMDENEVEGLLALAEMQLLLLHEMLRLAVIRAFRGSDTEQSLDNRVNLDYNTGKGKGCK